MTMNNRITKTLRGKAGFTLVELIVVIAILGILAGVGTVGYSGYIKKANEAADQQLLGFVNQAFAAACLENGDDINSLTSATLNLTGAAGAKKVDSVDDKYNESFMNYYAGNEDSTFKVFTTIIFDKSKHLFMDAVSAGYQAFTYGGGTVYISPEDAQALKDSGFLNYDGLNAEALLNKVNYVAGFAAELGADVYVEMFSDPAYLKSAAESFGVDTTGMTEEEIAAAWESKLAELSAVKFKELTGKDLASLSDEERESYQAYIDQADSLILANTAVLYAAQNTSQQSTDILALLTTTDPKATILANMEKNKADGLSQAAVAYGMYMAYAYSTGETDLIESTDDPVEILKALDDEGFQNYLKDTDGSGKVYADLDGYLAAMSMINSSTGDSDAVASLLVNGFADKDLVDLIENATK